MSDRYLSGKTALVSGAGQGVGQGIALALAEHGAAVALLGRSVDKLEETRALIEAAGGRALAVAANVKNADELAAAVDATVSHFGGLNILVNNAQEVPLGTLLDLKEEAVEAGWQSGPVATLRLMRLCYPHLKDDGAIVNLASSAAMRWDMSGYGAYAAVKEAIRALSRAAACEWAADGIRTNVILPHAMSPSLKWWTEARPEEAAEFVQSIPMKRIGECKEDIGEFVATLCSDACRYVNGQSIALDGGQANLG